MSLKDDLATVTGKTPKPKPAPKKKTNGKKPSTVISKPKVTAKLFAHALIRNSMNASAAYRELRPDVTAKTARTEGNKYLAKPDTIHVLTPLLESLFSKAGVETEYVFRRWLEFAQASAADYFNFDHGTPVLDMSDMSPMQRANLKSISINHTAHGTNYKIEVYDAQKAVDTIGKHLGLLIDKMDPEDVERIGDLIERGVNRIRESRDLDGWKDVILDAEYVEVK